MSDGVRDIAHPMNELLDLVEHAVDRARQGVELVGGVLNGQTVTEIALHDGLNGMPQSVHTLQHRPPDHQSAQNAGAQQNRHSGSKAIPESRRQRGEQRLVPADEQMVAAGKQ